MRNIVRALALALVLMLIPCFSVLAVDNNIIGRSIYSDWDDIGVKYKDAVLGLSIHSDGLNIFQGSDGRFYPKKTFTRAEVLALVAVVKVGGNPDKLDLNTLFAADAASGQRFYDVPRTHWAFGAINYAARMGFIEGTGGNFFNPAESATVEMVCSMLLSLLGVKAEDKNGTDWAAKTTDFMLTRNVMLDEYVTHSNPTREEIASALDIAVKTNVFQKNTDGTYSQMKNTLLQTAFGYPEDKQIITLTGKVIGTKYASLNGVNNYNRSVLLEGVGVNDGKANGTVFRLETPESDEVVPVALLSRVVTLKVCKINEGLYRAADDAKAEPLYTTDVVSLPLSADGTLNEALYKNAVAEIPDYSSQVYDYLGIRGNSVQFRGAYTNYGASGGYSADWKSLGNWSYAYAVTFGNTNYYSEIFYLNYRVMMVSDIYNGNVTFKALDGVTSVDVNDAKRNSFENGASLSKGDIIVAVVDAKNNVVTAEKLSPQTGKKQRDLTDGGIIISGVDYNLWDSYINYANREMPGSWAGGVQWQIKNSSTITFWSFRPIYGEYTGSEARLLHYTAPNAHKDQWFEWEQPNYCIVINASAGTSTSNATVTIVAANGKDSGTYRLNNLYVREVSPLSWLGDMRMRSTLAKNPVNGFGLDTEATKGITMTDTATANGLFWATYASSIFDGALSKLSGINIYSFTLASGFIDLTELDASMDSGMEILYVHKNQSSVTADGTFIINQHESNKVLYSEGRATDTSDWIKNAAEVSESYTLNTADTIWFTLKTREGSPLHNDPTVLSNWNTGYPSKTPDEYIFVFTVDGRVKFIIYDELREILAP